MGTDVLHVTLFVRDFFRSFFLSFYIFHFLHFILVIYASNYVGMHLFDILTAGFLFGDYFFFDLHVPAIQFFSASRCNIFPTLGTALARQFQGEFLAVEPISNRSAANQSNVFI